MANRLEKIQQVGTAGGGGPGGSGGGSDGPTEPIATGLPPQGSPCYEDLLAKVAKLWPNHNITLAKSDSGNNYLRVADFGNGYVWRVTGTCKNGYIKIDYGLIQSPGIGSG